MAGQSASRGGDRNRTSSISEKRPSISASTAGAEDNNCLTESNRGTEVNRQHRNSLVRDEDDDVEDPVARRTDIRDKCPEI